MGLLFPSRLLSSGLVVAALTGAGGASAQPGAPVEPGASPSPPVDTQPATEPVSEGNGSIDLTAQSGILVDATHHREDSLSGLVMGVMALGHVGPLVLGGALDLATNLSGGRLGASALGGLSYRAESGYGMELLGAFGVHRYEGIGNTIVFHDDPGVSGSLPFVGGRLRFDRVFRSSSLRWNFGGTLGAEHDLDTVAKTSTYRPWLTLGDDNERVTSQHTLGFTTVSVTLDFGLTLD